MSKELIDVLSLILVLLFIWFLIMLYFWPTRIAYRKNHIHKFIILILNLFAGVTFIVWIILLFGAYDGKSKDID